MRETSTKSVNGVAIGHANGDQLGLFSELAPAGSVQSTREELGRKALGEISKELLAKHGDPNDKGHEGISFERNMGVPAVGPTAQWLANKLKEVPAPQQHSIEMEQICNFTSDALFALTINRSNAFEFYASGATRKKEFDIVSRVIRNNLANGQLTIESFINSEVIQSRPSQIDLVNIMDCAVQLRKINPQINLNQSWVETAMTIAVMTLGLRIEAILAHPANRE